MSSSSSDSTSLKEATAAWIESLNSGQAVRRRDELAAHLADVERFVDEAASFRDIARNLPTFGDLIDALLADRSALADGRVQRLVLRSLLRLACHCWESSSLGASLDAAACGRLAERLQKWVVERLADCMATTTTAERSVASAAARFGCTAAELSQGFASEYAALIAVQLQHSGDDDDDDRCTAAALRQLTDLATATAAASDLLNALLHRWLHCPRRCRVAAAAARQALPLLSFATRLQLWQCTAAAFAARVLQALTVWCNAHAGNDAAAWQRIVADTADHDDALSDVVRACAVDAALHAHARRVVDALTPRRCLVAGFLAWLDDRTAHSALCRLAPRPLSAFAALLRCTPHRQHLVHFDRLRCELLSAAEDSVALRDRFAANAAWQRWLLYHLFVDDDPPLRSAAQRTFVWLALPAAAPPTASLLLDAVAALRPDAVGGRLVPAHHVPPHEQIALQLGMSWQHFAADVSDELRLFLNFRITAAMLAYLCRQPAPDIAPLIALCRKAAGHAGIWIEKYRPKQLDDVISHEAIIGTINRLIDSGKLPHLLFYGPAGVGKTSTIMACAQKMYGPGYKSMILELNASDDRGIDVVREEIKTFASTRKIFSSGVKLVVLDEADSLTKDAQAALRRVIEKYTRTTRFCLICNFVNKIIPALQSRCTRFRFSPLSEEQVLPRLRDIIAAEAVTASDDGVRAIVRLAGGDMRKCLNILQSAHMSFAVVDEAAVYKCTGNPPPADVDQIMQWLLNENFAVAFANIQTMMTEHGFALQDVLTEVYQLAARIQFSQQTLARLFVKLAKIEEDISRGSSEKLQLAALVGIFQIAKETVMT